MLLKIIFIFTNVTFTVATAIISLLPRRFRNLAPRKKALCILTHGLLVAQSFLCLLSWEAFIGFWVVLSWAIAGAALVAFLVKRRRAASAASRWERRKAEPSPERRAREEQAVKEILEERISAGLADARRLDIL